MAEEILVNRTVIRSRFLDGSVFIDAIDLINYLVTEQDIKIIKKIIVELSNDISVKNGVSITLRSKEARID